MSEPKISVVIATYNRGPGLRAVLEDLGAQVSAPPFEVVLVDDGSEVPAWRFVDELQLGFPLAHERQENQGAAAARDNGVRLARGEIVIIVDDDMRLPPDFVAAHAALHADGADVVLGHIRAPDDRAARSLHERFHMFQLERQLDAFQGGLAPRGVHLCTGNVSFSRRLYLDVGGFDRGLERSEDRELGIRFELAGANIVFGEAAVSYHESDHDSLEQWLGRAFRYGDYDSHIARKHPGVENADPWAFIYDVNPVSRPLLVLSAAAPGVGKVLRDAVINTAELMGSVGRERWALNGMTLGYGIEYFRGMRKAAGSGRGLVRDFLGYASKRARTQKPQPAPITFIGLVARDFDALAKAQEKYRDRPLSKLKLPVYAVTKIGFQMAIAVRLMRLVKDLGVPLGPQTISRLIRLAYNAEIHWDAEIGGGLVVVHGNGLVISSDAKVGEDCVFFHNVTLGYSRGEGGADGAPVIEDGVHIGPGAVLLGPITVGHGAKVMANAVVTESVPPVSVVVTPPPDVKARVKPRLVKKESA
jgi:serine acetyltransferase/glycosyltransferase involved in cell wall biosynthesis